MTALQSQYPEGMAWTNDTPYTVNSPYTWNARLEDQPNTIQQGGGCAAFAYMLSDAAFGDLTARKHTDFDNIRVGDILRINHDAHSVIVLEVKESSVIVAEGNYNDSIHWGREIPFTDIGMDDDYILTRHPQEN